MKKKRSIIILGVIALILISAKYISKNDNENQDLQQVIEPLEESQDKKLIVPIEVVQETDQLQNEKKEESSSQKALELFKEEIPVKQATKTQKKSIPVVPQRQATQQELKELMEKGIITDEEFILENGGEINLFILNKCRVRLCFSFSIYIK